MTAIPKVSDIGGGLSFVSLYLKLNPVPIDLIRYQVTGHPDGDSPKTVEAIVPGRRIEGSFEFNLYGEVTSPDAWVGYRCEVMFNRLGMAYDDELTPDGFIGDGWCESGERVLVRFTLPAEMLRDLIELWGLVSGRAVEKIALRCDLVDLREWHDNRETIGYKIVRLYT